MLENKLLKQYCWILRVLDSCRNEEQIETCQNLFSNFMKNNIDIISNAHSDTFVKVFEVEKKNKTYSLYQKRKSKSSFNSSKFFKF